MRKNVARVLLSALAVAGAAAVATPAANAACISLANNKIVYCFR